MQSLVINVIYPEQVSYKPPIRNTIYIPSFCLCDSRTWKINFRSNSHTIKSVAMPKACIEYCKAENFKHFPFEFVIGSSRVQEYDGGVQPKAEAKRADTESAVVSPKIIRFKYSTLIERDRRTRSRLRDAFVKPKDAM